MKRKFKEWDDEKHLQILNKSRQKKICKRCSGWDGCAYKNTFDGRCIIEEKSDEKEVEE